MRTKILAFTVASLVGALAVNADIEIKLRNDWIKKHANNATIAATFTVDKAPKKIHPQKEDGEIHIAGRAPEVQLPIVAEVSNARNVSGILAHFQGLAEGNQTISMRGAWRLWCEHAGMDAQVQGQALDPFTTTNPEHVFEIHPISQAGNIDLTSTFTPISGYTPKEAERAFQIYENLSCEITAGSTTTTIRTSMAGMNFTEFQMRLREVPQETPSKDGFMLLAQVEDLNGELLVHKRRMVFVKGTPPADKVKTLKKGDCLHVLGIPRINLTLVAWRVAHRKERPGVLDWNLPYEMIIFGIYPGACNDLEEDE